MKSQIKKIKNKFKTKFINFQSIKYAKSEKEFELPDIASYDAISNEWRLEDDCEEEISINVDETPYPRPIHISRIDEIVINT